ncbi:MAG TPA: hypothetical protein VFQ42_04310 [Mycobacterium sp.]|nr:hypothetical protein [Mycobacterium sp.]
MSHCDGGGEEFPPAGDGGCCWGEIVNGPAGCTCWKPVYDLDQAEPDPTAVRWLGAGVTPVTRRRMCHDCAYRPNSPEKRGEEGYAGDAEFLERIAAADERFWCHQGIRRPAKWVHPSGAEWVGSPAAYSPPKVNGVPYRADGSPAELCAGWDARRRALAAERDEAAAR